MGCDNEQRMSGSKKHGTWPHCSSSISERGWKDFWRQFILSSSSLSSLSSLSNGCSKRTIRVVSSRRCLAAQASVLAALLEWGNRDCSCHGPGREGERERERKWVTLSLPKPKFFKGIFPPSGLPPHIRFRVQK